MSDEWEALFDLWHHRAHEASIQVKNDLFADLAELERRIVKLEAYVSARRKAKAGAWEFANAISGTVDWEDLAKKMDDD